MKKVFRAANITEAHIVKGLLESNGIEAYVDGFYLQGGIGELATMDFVSVSVEDEDQAVAREIVYEYENTNEITDQE